MLSTLSQKQIFSNEVHFHLVGYITYVTLRTLAKLPYLGLVKLTRGFLEDNAPIMSDCLVRLF